MELCDVRTWLSEYMKPEQYKRLAEKLLSKIHEWPHAVEAEIHEIVYYPERGCEDSEEISAIHWKCHHIALSIDSENTVTHRKPSPERIEKHLDDLVVELIKLNNHMTEVG